ncbi:hypothetical protein [Endozoicomonas arenosclerae]|uniref:hypothetical protein n=1 Tax=Endozoicomonas arenosclerae TaxID=1633495 RepID=UPI0007826138|nr:hypothetical protein [Endozoicomonas arenosclerae]
MHILTSVYHGLSGIARTVKDGVVSRFRGKKAEVVKHPVRKMTERSPTGSDTQQGSVASKGYLLAKELSDQALPAHKVSSLELPPRFPYVETREESQTPQESPSRARKILTALMPGNASVPKDSDISLKRAKRWQTRRLRKGLQTIKRETGLEVSIRNFDHQAAKLRDFLTGSGVPPDYHEIKAFCDDVQSVMAQADSLPGLVKLAVTEYMVVLSDLGQAAQSKAQEQRQQLAERFLPGHDGFKAHCLRNNIDPNTFLSLQALNQFQGKIMGWQDEQGFWHQGLVDSLELSSMQALKDKLEAELEGFIDQIGRDIPESRRPSTPLNQDQLQAEVARLYAKHGVKDLPNKQQNPIAQSSAEQHPILQSATKYQVQPFGHIDQREVVSLEKGRLHHWVFEQQLADLKAQHQRLDDELDSFQQEHSEAAYQRRNTPEFLEHMQERHRQLHKRKANIPFAPLPTLVLRNSKGASIDSDFIKKSELDEPGLTLHVDRCQIDDYKQINRELLRTPGFESKEALDQFKDTMRSFRNQCYQYAIGATLPSRVFSENDTQLLMDCRQRINTAMETMLANPETGDTTVAFHYLRMQEAVLEKFLKMNSAA